MSINTFCYLLMDIPKYRDMTPEEKERCDFLRVVLDGNTMICEHYGFCATSPTWGSRGMCFSKGADNKNQSNQTLETT